MNPFTPYKGALSDDSRSQISLLTTLDQFIQRDKQNVPKDKKVLVIYTSGAMGGEFKNRSEKLIIQKGTLRQKFKENSYLCDLEYTQTHSDGQCLVTPVSAYGRRTYYKVQEFQDIKNSRQTKVSDVYQLAQIIKENYESYQSFIVICGVATLTYVASLLSFMLENLSKTVIVTGCLIPVSFMRNDAFQNMLNSLTLAGHFIIPEVLVVFGSKAFRGNRTRIIESDSFDGIESPNFPPLVSFGITVDINWSLVLRREQGQGLTLSPPLVTDVIVLKVTPFTNFDQIKYILDLPNLRCCIFECYPFGEMPHSDELLELLKSQEKREIVVVMIQQCIRVISEKAGLKSRYKNGLIVRYDITPEAAVAKMGYLLGKQYSVNQIRSLFQKNLQGEVDSTGVTQKFEGKHLHFLQSLTEHLQKNTGDDQIFRNIEFVNRYIVPNLGCYMAKIGSLGMIKELRKIVSNLSIGDYDNRTMLHVAVAEQQMEIVQYLVEECKVDVNVIDCQGCTPMYDALIHRHKKMLFYLIQHGGKIKAPNEMLSDLVLEAAAEGDVEFLEMLFHTGTKDLNEFVNIDYRNAGHIAVCCNQEKILQFLKFKAYFDFSQRDRWQRTPYDDARLIQNKSIIRLLADVIN